MFVLESIIHLAYCVQCQQNLMINMSNNNQHPLIIFELYYKMLKIII